MLQWKDAVMSGERHQDFRREADHDRLVLEARMAQPARASLFARAWAALRPQPATPRAPQMKHAGLKA